jgi:hypothetical protein
MTNKRRPGMGARLTPTYDDEISVANKVTLNPHHPDYERTILLPEPRGRKARETTVELMPFLEYMSKFVDVDGNIARQDIQLFSGIITTLWSKKDFEERLLPFVLGLDPNNETDRETLESLTLTGAFEAFIQGFNYLMSGSNDEEFQAAKKKSNGEEKAADEQG